MADASILRFLRWGTHSSDSEWTTTPTMTAFLEPEGEVVLDAYPRHVDRGSVQRGNGQRVPRVTVGKDTSRTLPAMSFGLRGLSGSGATGATSSLTHDLDGFLTALFGIETEGTGDTLSNTPGSGTTILADGAVSMTVGQGVLMLGATDGKYVARQVTGTSGSNFTIDRDLYTSTGVAQDPTADSVVYGMRTYALSSITPNRTHIGFDFEGDNYRNQVIGCMGNASIVFASGTYGVLNLDGWRFTDCTDDDELSVSNPTYSAPTRGSLIQGIDATCHIGTSTYLIASDLTVNLGLTISPRGALVGPNGSFGYVVTAVNPTVTWAMIVGTGTAPNEVTDTILATFRNDTPKDVSFQIGRTVGATAYIRAPAMDIVAERGSQDGIEVITCTGTPTDASGAFAAYPHCLTMSFA